jgi:hypothetical protein
MGFHVIGRAVEQAAPLTLPEPPLTRDEHRAIISSYRVRFASYIRSGETTHDRFEDVPEQWRVRVLAVQAYDAHGAMLGSELVEGRYLEEAVGRFLADPNARYLQLHYTFPGRYAARIERG